jgi:hypothetical protein
VFHRSGERAREHVLRVFHRRLLSRRRRRKSSIRGGVRRRIHALKKELSGKKERDYSYDVFRKRMNDGDRFSIQSACKKRKLKTQATSASVFLPFGTNKKGQPPPKKKLFLCQLCFLSHEKGDTKKTKIGKRDERKCSYEFCCGSIV